MNRRKSLILIAMVVLLLTFAVSGTIAWLADSTDEVVNGCTPGEVETEIVEEFDNTAKTSIIIKNDKDAGSTVSVYVRVSVSGYWCDKDGKIIAPWAGLTASDIRTGWSVGADGYYYYSQPIAPGESTSNLLTNSIVLTQQTDGSYLVVNVVHQSIQAEPTSTVASAWGVTVAKDGTISKN